MNIPDDCQEWVCQMERTEASKEILGNVHRDGVTPEDVGVKFFVQLTGHFPPDWPASDDEGATLAKGIALKVVIGDRDGYVCCGGVLSDGIFVDLMRVERPTSFRYLFPTEVEREDFFGKLGITDKQLADYDVDDFKDVLDHVDISGDFRIGNQSGVGNVWVTDYRVTPKVIREDHKALVDRLGLPHLEGEDFLLRLDFKRASVPATLHIPGCFDAIDFPPFRVQVHPDAPHGVTFPLHSPPDEGLPEAVHRACLVERSAVTITPIKSK